MSRLQRLISEADRCIRTGEFNDAAALLREAVQIDARDPLVNIKVAELALSRADLPAAEEHFKRAIKADPTLIQIANNLAILYVTSGRPQLAIDVLEPVLAMQPNFAPGWFNLGNARMQSRAYEEAIASYEMALKHEPHYANALTNLARAYRLTLQHERAIETLQRSAEIDRTPLALSSLIFSAMFSRRWAASKIVELGRSWDARFAKPRLNVVRSKDPERAPRIAYFTPNFSGHTIGRLIEPILERHDGNQFSIYCYSDGVKEDQTTRRIRALPLTFRATTTLDDHAFCDCLQNDQIDILIDLNLHMSGTRLGALSRHPAPIQINYLAFPFTAGIRAMDYRLTDTVLDPAGAPRFGPESLIRLEHGFWLYRPDAAAPVPGKRMPASADGVFTFGNLNDTKKLNAEVAAAWTEILDRVPQSRLVLLADDATMQRVYFERLFSKVDPRRIELVDKTSHAEHLARYQTIDLGLDPFPYGGHSTALDSLWMGVPIITLVGNAPYTRGAASMLVKMGLGDLVTDSLKRYIDLAVILATEPARLAVARSGLRERFRSSPICDEAGFVREFESALRLAWQNYCQGLNATDIATIA